METEIEALRRSLAQAVAEKAAAEAAKAAAEARAAAAEAAAEAAKAAAEARAAAAEAAAEAAKATAEEAKAAAEARAAAAEAAVEAGHKREFLAALRGVSASASENSSVSADTARRGAPEPVEVPLSVFFQDWLEVSAGDWPEVSAADVEASWKLCRELLCSRDSLAVPLEDALKDQPERAFVHDVMFPLLHAMTQGTELRLWREGHLADSVPLAVAIPDMLWTHVRDVSASSLGALLCGDFKRWGLPQLQLVRSRVRTVCQCAFSRADAACCIGGAQATTQSASYTRRIVGRLTREADDRGEPLHAVGALSVACVGSHLRLLRMRSGAPKSGTFAGAQPCPVDCTPALPLLADWDPRAPAASCPLEAPPAFVALLRLLRAPASRLNPLTAPRALVELACGPLQGTVQLGERLGCGGRCDAYRVADATGCHVLKLPRCATTDTMRDASAEADALRALAAAPDDAVPRLVAEGVRVMHSRSAGSHAATLQWPALLLSPAGTPLSAALTALAPAASAPAQRDARRRLADVAVAGILRGLHATHQARRVHCDVRPSNVIFVSAAGGDGAAATAMLVDYGLCRLEKEQWPRLGDRSFAAERAYGSNRGPAAAGLDLYSAALTWLALARGGGGSASAPWGKLGDGVHTWLRNAAEADAEAAPALRSLDWHLRSLAAARDTPAPECYYTWPWPHQEQRPTRAAASSTISVAARA
jgi:hypothetical protein